MDFFRPEQTTAKAFLLRARGVGPRSALRDDDGGSSSDYYDDDMVMVAMMTAAMDTM